ncbi:MAG: protein translocase subunit SecDF [Bacteroidota bacterium]
MRNRSLVIFLTSVTSLLCLYYLSFTGMDVRVQQKATKYATDEAGQVDFAKRQAYLDSVWKEPVFDWLGIRYTYEAVKENALTLGLDLQGGMHVTLEVSPMGLIQGLAGNSKDETFLAALQEAEQKHQVQPSLPFTKVFYQAYQKIRPEGKLSDIFSTAANRARITRETSDQAILKLLDEEISSAVDRSFEVIRARIDQFGTLQPNIQRLPGDRIQIELPGVNNPARVRKLLQGVGQLQFWQVYELVELENALQAVDNFLSTEQSTAIPIQVQQPTEFGKYVDGDSAQQPEQGHRSTIHEAAASSPLLGLLKPSHGLAYAIEDVPAIQQILARKDVKTRFPTDLVWLWDAKPLKLDDGTEVLTLYPIKSARGGKALLAGDVITDARQSFDRHGKPAVSIHMNSRGASAWRKITAKSIGKQIAITLDDKVYSAPVVSTEIPDGNSEITGSFTIEEAKDLASILKAGSLPAPVKIVEEALIGPTLSQAAQAKGITAMLLGLVLVALFMLLYYAQGGAIANVALLFNILFVLGTLAQLNTALTLPGIAGIVLTIGMSIDANVLIFERIREELNKGMQMPAAIHQGYQKAYSSIIDANVTTFLTGAILYGLGQGPVRGFATTLMVGIVTSLFTAVLLTRLIISWLVNNRRTAKLSFDFAHTQSLLSNVNLNFLGNRYLFYTISGVFISLGSFLMVQQGGLNLGVDFTGGRSYVVAFSHPVEATALKTNLAHKLDDQGVEVKTYGANNVLKITTNYLIQEEAVEADERVRNTLIEGLTSFTGLTYTDSPTTSQQATFAIVSATKVGGSIAGDVQSAAKKSILFSLIMIFGYIVARFRRWQLGLAAVAALLHDSLAVLAAFAIARALGYAYEIDQVFIAAILTIIGYSINDTVVVFDRIRENRRTRASSNFPAIANTAINETLSRTLITSFTTLMAVLVLFVWGGEVLRGFSFALLAGIIFGTYSSICIAAPLFIDLARLHRPRSYRRSK